MATSVVNPRAQFFANNGRPLIGGRIHTYVAGSSTRARTYKDAAKAQPNTNPIILDGRGESQIYLAEGVEYKFVVEDSKGALIYTQEPVYGAVWPNAADWPSDATLSYQFMMEAKAAADAVSLSHAPFDTYVQLSHYEPSLGDGVYEVSRDETRDGARTRYKKEDGVLAFILAFEQYYPDGASHSRAMQSKLGDTISVRDYITTRIDGVTSNQAGIEAAVAAAYAAGAELEWPAGTYVSDADIPNFHDVSHVGKGIVKRGAYTFAAAPANKMSMRNIIYVSASGSGDGLSPDFPATLDIALAAISFRGPALTGLWGIQLAAGTYTAPTETLSNITSDNYILIAGPDVSGGVPTASIDANGGEQALRIIGRCNVQLQDIKGINATASSVASAFIVDNGGTVYAQNVHTYNTSWAGINFNVAQRAVVYGGRFENSAGYGVRCYGGTVLSIGKDGDRPQFVNCVLAGAVAQGTSYGHIDYCDFNNCGVGVNTVFDSHVACLECTFTNCATPAQAEHNSSISFNPTSMTGFTRQMRSRRGVQVYDGANNRFDEQTYPYLGTNGKTAYGYSDWVVPTCKFQYSNNGTTSGFNLSSLAAATALWESNGNTILALAAPTANYSALWFADATHERRAEIRQSGGALNMLFSGASAFRFRNTDFAASTDNALSNGTATLRWSVVYAGTGTINTSDAREKQQIRDLSDAERAVAVRLKSLIRAFKFNDAVGTKGDKARIHVGVIAQDVKAAFEAEGLVAEDYAVLCYDEWDETPEERDEEGNVVQEYRPAGNRYGVRYEELLSFIIVSM